MKLTTLRATKTATLQTDAPYNQNARTAQAKKILKSGPFLGGGVRSIFFATLHKLL